MIVRSARRSKDPGLRRRATALGLVVLIVRVEEPPPLMDEELKLHELSAGSPVHTPEFSEIVPLKPFTAVTVRTACPEPPGDAMETVEGAKAMLKLAAALTVTTTGEEVGAAE